MLEDERREVMGGGLVHGQAATPGAGSARQSAAARPACPCMCPACPALPECAAASSRPICSTDCWLLLPPDHANSVSSSMMSFLLPSYMHKRARKQLPELAD